MHEYLESNKYFIRKLPFLCLLFPPFNRKDFYPNTTKLSEKMTKWIEIVLSSKTNKINMQRYTSTFLVNIYCFNCASVNDGKKFFFIHYCIRQLILPFLRIYLIRSPNFSFSCKVLQSSTLCYLFFM